MSEIVVNPEEYFRQFLPQRDDLLLALEEEARREEIPIIGPLVGSLLALLVGATRSSLVLELGTATGYSAIFLARALDLVKGRLVTVELDRAMAERARDNFRKAGLEHRVELRTGSALEEMAAMTGPFDLIFLDIEKEHYAPALPACERLLRSGGLLIADNTGFAAADPFNRRIAASPAWQSANLLAFLPDHSPERDGICLALRV